MATANLISKLDINLVSSETKTAILTNGATATDLVSVAKTLASFTYSTGAGANLVSKQFYETYSGASPRTLYQAGATVTPPQQAIFSDVLQGNIALNPIKLLYIFNSSAVDLQLKGTIWKGLTNLDPGATPAYTVIPASSSLLLSSPTGYTIGTATTDTLVLTAATGSLSYDIVIIGQ
jgi:hypothetical protein